MTRTILSCFYNIFLSFNNNIPSNYYELSYQVIPSQYLPSNSYSCSLSSKSCSSILIPLLICKKSSFVHPHFVLAPHFLAYIFHQIAFNLSHSSSFILFHNIHCCQSDYTSRQLFRLCSASYVLLKPCIFLIPSQYYY